MNSRKIPDFASVALVDILANGVGMLIILIVISISSRFEAEQRQLEQVSEASVVLSRTISTDIVRNRLAASPPASLHDYQNSPLDRVLDVRRMPIIELHREFVRDYYSGAVYPRPELLLEDNRLDVWLASLTPRQGQAVRVDIYAVRQFYLAMSILRSHNIESRHWHFMRGGGLSVRDAGVCPAGVAGSQCIGLGGSGDSSQSRAAQALRELLSAGDGSAGREQGSATQGEDGADAATMSNGENVAAASAEPRLPGGSDLRDLGHNEANMGRYLADSNDDFGQSASKAQEFGGGSAAPGVVTDFDELMHSMGQSSIYPGDPSADSTAAEPQLSRATFRRAGERPTTRRSGRQPEVSLPPLRVVLAVLLEYLREIQAELDDDRGALSLIVNFTQNLSQRFSDPPLPNPQDSELIEPLVRLFIERWPESEPLQLAQRQDEQIVGGLAMAVPVNHGLQVASLRGDSLQDVLPDLPAPRRIALHLNSYPTTYEGTQLSLQRNAVLLMASEQRHTAEYRWRVVTYIPPSFEDFVLGFVYAAVADDGQLLLHPSANHIAVDELPLRVLTEPRQIGARGWLALCFAAAVLGLIWALIFELRRQRRVMPVRLEATI